MLPCVLPNMSYVSFRTWAMCPSEHEAGFTPPTSSETYPYPKGEHNGAEGPKYASLSKLAEMTK